ncbi:hypothetical protein QTG56_24365 (plasmid) [Rossellomorea sp. AcN35-11]|nr:hypothetical protein [Rossellomorea aquimaris]WJV31770.1 hypothetical protein QTG56_24365 [Rossellomorea sp. AcN35-11]
MNKGLCHSCQPEKENSKVITDNYQSLKKYLDTIRGAGVIHCEKCGCRVKYTEKEDGALQIRYVTRD